MNLGGLVPSNILKRARGDTHRREKKSRTTTDEQSASEETMRELNELPFTE